MKVIRRNSLRLQLHRSGPFCLHFPSLVLHAFPRGKRLIEMFSGPGDGLREPSNKGDEGVKREE